MPHRFFADKFQDRKKNRRQTWRIACQGLALTLCLGCGSDTPPATVEGTLRLHGKPLDHCLITFVPEPGKETDRLLYSTGVTDQYGHYHLQFNIQEKGATTGWHCVTIQDLSASSGTPRRDHGTREMEAQKAGVAARASRVRRRYLSIKETPLRKEIKRGHQVIDLNMR